MTRMFDFFFSILREADGGGAGGGDPAAAAAGGALAARAAELAGGNKNTGGDDDPKGGAGDPACAASGSPYFPEGIPEQFKGANDKETIDKLFTDINGRPKAPEKADAYTFTPSEDFTKKFGDLKDDKVLNVYREVAHELGLTNDQYTGSVEKLYGALDKHGLLDLGPDPDAEIELLKPKTGDEATRLASAQKRINDAGTFVASLETRGLPKAGVVMLGSLLENATGIQTIEFLQRTFQTPGLTAGGQPGNAGGVSRADVEKRMLDPRYDALSGQFDKGFYEETHRLLSQAPRKAAG